ncbi:MAG: hypothetical protein KJO54_04800 [Gammaproteobacteria bacterium]|nr:hypothetical protein [Gammaproteobacteria bacterium]NNF60655.1 hypothetical protein [Gammaproteobacteria bacterium]
MSERVRRTALLLMSALLGWTMALGPPNANAATNRAFGSIANGTLEGGDGSGEAAIELNSVQLSLVKQARDAAGNVLAAGADVSPGQPIWFVLLIDNVTSFPAAGIRISDILNESEFTYVPDSIETATVASGSDDATIWSGTWSSLTDAVGAPDDIASITDSGGPPQAESLTVGAVTGQMNAPVSIPANTILAVRFRVTVN